MPSIAVIGGGPKAVALLARAWALASAGDNHVTVRVFEKNAIGASWLGSDGYTDGNEPLCTPAERDLGFPYLSSRPDIDRLVYERFSWASFLVDRQEYADWVARGRLPPSHSTFAEYLVWAADRAGSPIEIAEVTGLEWLTDQKKWQITYTVDARASTELYDGVVVTGAAPYVETLADASAKPHVFNARNFWDQATLEAIQKTLLESWDAGESPQVALIGSGGAAANIAAFLSRKLGGNFPIRVFGSKPTLYARCANYFEDPVFLSDRYWKTLPDTAKAEFINRLNSGTVWGRVIDQLGANRRIEYEFMRVGQVTLDKDTRQTQLCIVSKGSNTPSDFRARIAIEAQSFDPAWFIRLLAAGLNPSFNKDAREAAKEISRAVGPDLSISFSPIGGEGVPFPPRLHVPNLGAMISPGAPNLLTLGWLADRIISSYPPE